jgi:hypothetical protein
VKPFLYPAASKSKCIPCESTHTEYSTLQVGYVTTCKSFHSNLSNWFVHFALMIPFSTHSHTENRHNLTSIELVTLMYSMSLFMLSTWHIFHFVARTKFVQNFSLDQILTNVVGFFRKFIRPKIIFLILEWDCGLRRIHEKVLNFSNLVKMDYIDQKNYA